MTRFGKVVLAAATTVVASIALGAAPASAGAAMVQWQWFDTNWDGCWDTAGLDADGDGNPEDAWFDLDGDCRVETRMANAFGDDTRLEWLSYDVDEDGLPELVLLDTNGIAGYDLLLLDTNENGVWDQRPLASPTQTSFTIGGGYVSDYVAATSDIRTTLAAVADLYWAASCSQPAFWYTPYCLV